jgi:hypothetical protein
MNTYSKLTIVGTADEVWQGGEADKVMSLAGDVDMAAREMNPFLSGHSRPVEVTAEAAERLRAAKALLREARRILTGETPEQAGRRPA